MKNRKLQLSKKYTKLYQKIQKAIQSGRFQLYNTFKQQQLLSRLSRYSRQLGMTATVCASLGLATPAAAQINWQMHDTTAATNPFRVINRGYYKQHVDIDNDGDLDIFESRYADYNVVPYEKNRVFYYENTGSATSANYVVRPYNLIDSVESIYHPTFVDVDGDGDLDCFAGGEFYQTPSQGRTLRYYENTGTATVPSFVERIGNANPLDSVNIYNPADGYEFIRGLSFVDIDNDGDQDVMLQGSSSGPLNAAVYYKNTGTATSPIFRRQTTFPLPNYGGGSNSIQFIDIDNDGDFDAWGRNKFYENTGTASNPSFVERTGTADPFSNLNLLNKVVTILDADNDGDYDLLDTRVPSTVFAAPVYQENLTINLNASNIENKLEFKITPNPSKGVFQLEYAISGDLVMANILGATVHQQSLDNVQVLNISHLPKGVYFLKIEITEGLISEKIIIEK